MTKIKKLNISDVLNRLDNNDYTLYDGLDDVCKKEFSPWLVMRFMSSCENNPELYLLSVNEAVNDGFSLLSQHKKLISLLLASCGVGSRQHHKWIAPQKATKNMETTLLDILKEIMPDKNNQELTIIKNIHTDDEMIEYLTICGIEEKRIKAIFGNE